MLYIISGLCLLIMLSYVLIQITIYTGEMAGKYMEYVRYSGDTEGWRELSEYQKGFHITRYEKYLKINWLSFFTLLVNISFIVFGAYRAEQEEGIPKKNK